MKLTRYNELSKEAKKTAERFFPGEDIQGDSGINLYHYTEDGYLIGDDTEYPLNEFNKRLKESKGRIE